MLFDYFGDLNWWAVIVAALAYWVLGAIWFSDAVMGKQWREASGLEDSYRPSAGQIVGNLVTWLVTAIALGLISHGIEAGNAGDGIVLGLVASIGFIGMNRITEQLYTRGDRKMMMVNAPYTVIGFVVMGIILATWT